MPVASGALAGAEVGSARPAGSGLPLRIASGVVLAAVALGATWYGGWAFALLVALGVGMIFHEWGEMHGIPRSLQLSGMLIVSGAAVVTHLERMPQALVLLALGALLLPAAAFAANSPGKGRIAAGLLYAGLPAIALVWLRGLPEGFALVIWTMGVVWATDIFAYFAGRAVGGPKIWPAISPNKTWAGLIGGMKAAAIFAGVFAWMAGWPTHPLLYAVLGAVLALLAQSGDFFESWLKRRAGIKDSGSILPGHGGVMDRVDGLVPVACAVAFFVALAGGSPL